MDCICLHLKIEFRLSAISGSRSFIIIDKQFYSTEAAIFFMHTLLLKGVPFHWLNLSFLLIIIWMKCLFKDYSKVYNFHT